MYITQTVAPINEVVTLAEAKLFAIIDIDDDDAVIQGLIESCVAYTQNFTNRQLLNATFELYNDSFTQDMIIPKGNLDSIIKVEYMDQDGSYQELSTDDYYSFGDNDIFKIHFDKTPTHKQNKNAVKITFISGYGSLSTDVPSGIKIWIKMKVKDLYEHRDMFEDFSKFVMPYSHIDVMLNMYRIQSV